MSRRGECIYKRKDGRWEARYVKQIGLDGKKKYGSVYADSYRAVKEKQRNCVLTQPEPPGSNSTLSQLSRLWLEHISCRVKPATYQKYAGLSANHILPELGSIPVNRLNRQIISKFAQHQLENGNRRGGPLSVKTVNDMLVILGLMMDFAGEEFQINTPKISLLREERKEARVLSVSEQATLTNHLLQEMDIFCFVTLLALYTGLRIGEICALTWADVSEDYLSVERTMQRLPNGSGETYIHIGSPKSSASRRKVPLPAFLKPYVKKFRKPDGFVLSCERWEHSEPRILHAQFQRIANDCGLEAVTFHTLRHTFATRCVEAGFDVKTLSEILGHSDVKTTLNRYVHSSFDLKVQNMERLQMPAGVSF